MLELGTPEAERLKDINEDFFKFKCQHTEAQKKNAQTAQLKAQQKDDRQSQLDVRRYFTRKAE